MIIPSKELALKNGQRATLRSMEVCEAAALIEEIRLTSAETHFMVRYPEEVTMPLEAEEEFLRRTNASPDAFMMGAFLEGELVGTIGMQPVGERIKYRHRAGFGISILEKACDLGLGSIMVKEMLDIAKKSERYTQLELGVFADNPRAIHVYEKLGFKATGVIPRAFRLKDGSYVDEVQMVYYLDKEE